MGRTRKEPRASEKAIDRLSFGVLSKIVPRKIVDEELKKAQREQLRTRSLPSYLVVYYAMAMCLYSQANLEQVLRWVLDGARHCLGLRNLASATKASISAARTRVGGAVLEALYRRVAKPLAQEKTLGAWHKGLRVVALDGSTLDLQDTKENAEHFGYAQSDRGECAFPKLRFVSLAEVGTHVLFGARMGPYSHSEQALAVEVSASLQKGMLCLADRLFYSYEFWSRCARTGAQLLWRARSKLSLPVEKELPDGSWLTTVHPRRKGRGKNNGLVVRVIKYRLEGPGAPGADYLLLTTLLDPQEHPARALAALYSQRWEIELAYDEFKTHLRGGRVVLRSKTPELVRQEFYGFLLSHFCAKHLMHESALANELPPTRLSFCHTIEVLRRRLHTAKAVFSPTEAEAVLR